MSVLVIAKVAGDTDVFRRALTERSGEFEKIVERAQAAGSIHHRFGIGDGYILIVDEWENAAQFERFFSDPELQAFVGEVGAAPGAPDVTVVEAVDSPDQY